MAYRSSQRRVARTSRRRSSSVRTYRSAGYSRARRPASRRRVSAAPRTVRIEVVAAPPQPVSRPMIGQKLSDPVPNGGKAKF